MGRPRRHAILDDTRHRLEWPALLERVSAYATSRPGKDALLRLTPSSPPTEAIPSLEEVAELMTFLLDAPALRLDELVEAPKLLAQDGPVASRVLAPDELRGLYRLLERSHVVGDTLRRESERPRLRARGDRLSDLPLLRERLERSVGPKGEILSTASPELESIRRRMASEERGLREWMEKRRQNRELRRVLQGDVISVRNDRFVFAVRAEHRHKVAGIIHGESSSGATLYIEPQEIVIRGHELATLRQKERHVIGRILAELTSMVRGERVMILSFYQELLELDMGVGRARFGHAFGCSVPEIVNERDLLFKEARHPLLLWREREPGPDGFGFDLEVSRARVTPLDVEIGSRFHQLVVTGPNTGGKTVVLKVVGLLSLMAFSGIPIPAAPGCRIPAFDAVLADIGDEQSLEQNLSTFSSHMTVISSILGRVSSRSLVLLDELGSGTDPLEGAALGEAILDRLYERGAFSVVTTHLGRLKEFAFRRKKCQNASMEFDLDLLAPTYRLIVGLPGRSNATIIARRIGVPPDVIEHAEKIRAGEDRIDEEVLDGLERTRRDLEQRRAEMERHRREAKDLKRSASEEVEALRSLQSAIEYESEQAEETRVREVVEGVREALKAMGDPPRERREPFERLQKLLDAALVGTSLGERRQALGRTLKKGDVVFVPRLRAVCEIRKINKSKAVLTVSLNGIPTEVGFNDISWLLPPPGYELAWYEE